MMIMKNHKMNFHSDLNSSINSKSFLDDLQLEFSKDQSQTLNLNRESYHNLQQCFNQLKSENIGI